MEKVVAYEAGLASVTGEKKACRIEANPRYSEKDIRENEKTTVEDEKWRGRRRD